MEKMPRRRKCQPTLVFLPGKSHGQRSLVSYNPWGCKRVEHNLATKQQNVIFPIFEKNFSYSPFSATDSLLCLPLLGKLLEGAVQTHTSLFPFLYTILVTHASQSLHWNFSFMVTTVSIFLNLGSALTLICSVRNFFCSHFFLFFFSSWDIIQLPSRTRSSRSFLLWSLVLRLLCWFFLLFPVSS